MNGGGDIRLFLGVELSIPATNALAAVAARMRDQASRHRMRVRWVVPANYHITIKFLGHCDPAAIAAISDAMASRIDEVEPFAVQGDGLGAFPRPEKARVLWAGVNDPAAGLYRLAEIADSQLEPLGFGRERREYHPHVTLARVRHPSNVSEVLNPDLLELSSGQVFRKTFIKALVLYESLMKSRGSEYVVRARFVFPEATSDPERQTEPLKPSAKRRGDLSHRSPGSSDKHAGRNDTANNDDTRTEDDRTGASEELKHGAKSGK